MSCLLVPYYSQHFKAVYVTYPLTISASKRVSISHCESSIFQFKTSYVVHAVVCSFSGEVYCAIANVASAYRYVVDSLNRS